MKSVAIFQNTKSQYGVLASFTKSLEEAFMRAGIQVKSFDFLKQSIGEILAAFAEMKPSCTIGFNVIPEHLSFELLDIPHIALMVDHASHHPALLQSKKALIGFMDEDSCKLFKILGHEKVFFFPHAIDKQLLERNLTQKRDLDVVMCGGCSDAGAILDIWSELFSKQTKEALVELAERVLTTPGLSHMQALVEAVDRGGEFAQEIKECGISGLELMNWLELYIRGIDRVRFLQAIEGVDIHLYGSPEEWKRALGKKKGLIFHEPVAFEKLPEILLRARCVINSMPTIKRGVHERLLLALACGASVLTNENVVIPTVFPQEKAVLSLLPPDYAKANSLLYSAFQNEEMRLDAVCSTHTTIKNHYTFDASVQKLILIKY